MSDPYRSGEAAGACPRCGSAIESDGELHRLVCRKGCGEWYPRIALDQMLDWHALVKPGGTRPQPWPWTAAACPSCRADMAVGYREELRFDYCGQHGVWLDTGELERFIELFRA